MIRRIGWPALCFVLLLCVLAKVQELDDAIEAGEFHQVTQLQRGTR